MTAYLPAVDNAVSTPIADALLAEYACDADVSDETWCVLVHALGEEAAR